MVAWTGGNVIGRLHHRLFGGGRVFSDFEREVLACVIAALPEEDASILAEQMDVMTSAHRYLDAEKGQSFAGFYWRYFGRLRRDHRRVWSGVDAEWKIASVTTTCGSQRLQTDVYGVRGHFFSIETRSNSDDYEPLAPDAVHSCTSTFRRPASR